MQHHLHAPHEEDHDGFVRYVKAHRRSDGKVGYVAEHEFDARSMQLTDAPATVEPDGQGGWRKLLFAGQDRR